MPWHYLLYHYDKKYAPKDREKCKYFVHYVYWLYITSICENHFYPLVTSDFPSERASNGERIPYHVTIFSCLCVICLSHPTGHYVHLKLPAVCFTKPLQIYFWTLHKPVLYSFKWMNDFTTKSCWSPNSTDWAWGGGGGGGGVHYHFTSSPKCSL